MLPIISASKPKAAAGAAAPGGKGAAAPGGLIKDSDTERFVVDVLDASRSVPVIVDFWAPWCGPCKTLGPQIEKAVTEAKGAVRMVKINVDENQELAAQMRVQSIPAVYAFFNGRPVDGFVGAVPESQIKAFVQRLVKIAQTAGPAAPATSPIEEALEAAKEALGEGAVREAAGIYSQVLQADPENIKAAAGLARCYLVLGDRRRAADMLAELPDDAAKDPDVVSIKTTLAILSEAGEIGSVEALEAALAEDPANHQARYDLAMALFAQGKREDAVDALLDLVKRNRAWNEEAGRKMLIRLFEAFGPTDPLTISARKRLSSLLFA
ncbi:MAG: thioredoxin [Alphaproteobacteria bacterium]|nr:thioredoxin [Alphaproteobacteria bacterium]TAD88227.1 MAG: thioredoxin [Alphaproteobacteria bacterium]